MNTQENELWQNVKDKDYCNPAKRMDFILFYDVRDGNPNGDPDAGNLPRMDPQTGHGIVTDVCIKRKVRDYLSDVLGLNRAIYIKNDEPLNTKYFRAAREIVRQEPKDEDAKAVEALLVELDAEKSDEFKELISLPDESAAVKEKPDGSQASGEDRSNFSEWLASLDVDGLNFDPECGTLSYLGEANSREKFKTLLSQPELQPDPWNEQIGKLAKLLNDAKPKKGAQERRARDAVKGKMCKLYDDIRLFGAVLTAGTNAGQIRGPMQLTFGRSIEPILQMDSAITRCAITTAADWRRKQTEFGRKPWLNWAVYRQHGFYNPLLGQQTGLSREDLARFWESLACMFRNSDSASRGEMTMQDIVVFVHDHPRGNAPSHLLFEGVTCNAERNKSDGQGENEGHEISIKRDGFDHYYRILVEKPTSSGINTAYPLSDIWGID